LKCYYSSKQLTLARDKKTVLRTSNKQTLVTVIVLVLLQCVILTLQMLSSQHHMLTIAVHGTFYLLLHSMVNDDEIYT